MRLNQGHYIKNLSWEAVAQRSKQKPIIIIPLGAESKEHGKHLPLGTDAILAEKLTERACENLLANGFSNFLVAPVNNVNYYPAFINYPGSVSLSKETAINLIVEICQSYFRRIKMILQNIIQNLAYGAMPLLQLKK